MSQNKSYSLNTTYSFGPSEIEGVSKGEFILPAIAEVREAAKYCRLTRKKGTPFAYKDEGMTIIIPGNPDMLKRLLERFNEQK